MLAEIISIGDELLIGQTINTNASWLGEQLNSLGIRVNRSITISDDREEILKSLSESAARAQVIIMTGGLGPTKDDITKTTLCEYFNTDLKINEEALMRITRFFEERGLPMLEVNRMQAALPEACLVIQNHRGTACGMWFEKEGVIYVSMPGVPYEMKSMMEGEVFDRLCRFFERPQILHRTILTIGAGESFIAEKIKDWENSLTEHQIKLAYLPSPGMVKLRMSMYEGELEAQKSAITKKETELHELISEYIFGYEKDTLPEIIGRMLIEKQQRIATAESCTGGNIAQMITSVPGSSAYFVGSVVSYTEKIKEQELGVPRVLIEEKGVVSSEVAEAMAVGILRKYGVDFGLSTTGIAGPDGATEKYPVGSVWIAVASSKGVKSQLFRFGKSRSFNIEMASNNALNMLRKEILTLDC